MQICFYICRYLCSCFIFSLLYCSTKQRKDMLICDCWSRKQRGKQNSESIWTAQSHSESHILLRACRLHSCHWLAHKSRVISVPLRNETFSVLSVVQKKTSTTEKTHSEDSVRDVFDLNTKWVSCPIYGSCSLYYCLCSSLLAWELSQKRKK